MRPGHLLLQISQLSFVFTELGLDLLNPQEDSLSVFFDGLELGPSFPVDSSGKFFWENQSEFLQTFLSLFSLTYELSAACLADHQLFLAHQDLIPELSRNLALFRPFCLQLGSLGVELGQFSLKRLYTLRECHLVSAQGLLFALLDFR